MKDAINFAKHVVSLTRDVQKSKSDIADVREEVKDLRQEVNLLRQEMAALTRIVERLALELQHDRKNAERDREIRQLRLENILLRSDRGLPPGRPADDVDV